MSKQIKALNNKTIKKGDYLMADYRMDIYNYIVTDVDDYGITVSIVVDEDWSKGIEDPGFECFHSIEHGFPINADDCKELKNYGKATQFVVFDGKGRKRSSSWDFGCRYPSKLELWANGHTMWRCIDLV